MKMKEYLYLLDLYGLRSSLSDFTTPVYSDTRQLASCSPRVITVCRILRRHLKMSVSRSLIISVDHRDESHHNIGQYAAYSLMIKRSFPKFTWKTSKVKNAKNRNFSKKITISRAMSFSVKYSERGR